MMIRWTCPNELHPSVNGVTRPRKDNICRYCLPCSETTGKLVERVAPKLAKKRAAGKAKATRKQARRRAYARTHQTQADLVTRFRCGLDASHIKRWSSSALWEVRPCKNPRRSRIEEGQIILYDFDGCDKYDARAMVLVAELRHAASHRVLDTGRTGARLRSYIIGHLHDVITPTGIKSERTAERDLARTLRAEAAVKELAAGGALGRGRAA